ncbi:MAG: pyruvate kinase, partial [Clostridia bacterium]|nr:pyruvate kinase [Clostridia bacterium]
MRKTKIICTIGPACSDEKTLSEMMKGGMNVARLNFSHGTHEWHLEKMNMIKKLREELELPIAIMLDTKGPEYRIKSFKNGKVTLCDGDKFTFTVNDIEGDETAVSVNYKGLAKDLNKGDKILLNNGLLVFEVESTTDTDVNCRVISGGELSDRKSMSFPNKVLSQEYLSEQDKKDILFGISQDVDFIACSFVSRAQDLIDVKEFLDENGASGIELIAKIENQSGIDNIEEICSQCDGIMIGRGDMGVEIPFEELPVIQKQLITKCRMLGKRVITATEMLESMIHNPRPTRAETSDVANAVYDGTSAIMLSGETAAGKHPVLAVTTMARIAESTEKNIKYAKRFKSADFTIRNTVDAISHATCGMAIDISAKAIAVCTLSGMTARMVSRFRNPADI